MRYRMPGEVPVHLPLPVFQARATGKHILTYLAFSTRRMKKLLITGAQGFLGQRIAVYYANKYEIITCGHSDMDITDAQSVSSILQNTCPDIVFHCAALSDTGYSEQHPEESEAVNLRGATHIADSCRNIGCKLVYMSSDQVYNGNDVLGPQTEDLPLCPVNVYGRHKLEAERQITRLNPDAVGLRLTWMYDLPDSPYKLNRNLLVNLTETFRKQEKLKAAVREYRGITNVWDVIKRLEACIQLPGGIYNFGCGNNYNSYETFVKAARLLNLGHPEEWILPDPTRFPDHPRNLTMDTSRIEHLGIPAFPDTVTGIQSSLL